MGMTTTSLVRSRWAAIGAAVAVSLGAGGIGIGYAKVSGGERAVYDPINPCRLADFRPGSQVGPRGTPLGPDGVHTLDGWGATGDCNLPSGTAGLALNVTALDATAPTFLRFWPADGAQPTTANLNPTPGQPPTPNAVNVGLSSAGKFKVFNRFGTVNVVIDVVGVYVDHDHDDRYYTESEVDTLVASIPEGPQGPQGPPGPAAADYAHLIVVAESGGDFTSVGAAVDAVGVDPDYPAASSTERYLIWVAPGVYENEHVVMKPFVDIEGSGQGATVIRSVRGAGGISANAATVVGADNSELRKVRVEVEANAPANWSHAIYTATSTRFRDVSAASSGGSRTRGMVVATGGSPLLFDVALFASGGSVSNLGLDLFGSTASADGLYTDVSGGTSVSSAGVLLNGPSSEVQLENITTRVSGDNGSLSGVRVVGGRATLEGFRSYVDGSATNVFGATCDGATGQLTVLDGTVSVTSDAGTSRGVNVSGCSLELRNMVIDAVASSAAHGITHFHDNAVPADVAITDVEIRAESSAQDAFGLQLNGNLDGAGTYGHVSDVTIRASTASSAATLRGLWHRAEGEVRYRGLGITVAGAADTAHGIRTDDEKGLPRFDDVVIDADVEAESIVTGVELATDGSVLTNARVNVTNLASVRGHEAVGLKALTASDVEFSDVIVVTKSDAFTSGIHLVGSTARIVRADVRASSTGPRAEGLDCDGLSVEVHDSILHALESFSQNFGAYFNDCDAVITGTDISGASTGLSAFSSGPYRLVSVRMSSLSGASRSVVADGGSMNVDVMHSTLEGGPGFEWPDANLTCVAVTKVGGVFTTGPSCP